MFITLQEVETVLNAVKRVYPNRRNHHSEYTSPDGDHCLAGVVLAGLGVPVPEPEDGCNEAPFSSTPTQAFYASKGVDFSIEAIARIQEVQNGADFGLNYDEQRPWRLAIDEPYNFRF